MSLDHARALVAYAASFGETYGWPQRHEMSQEQCKEWVLACFWDILGEEDDDYDANWSGLFDFMEHCGMDLQKVRDDPKAAALSAEDIILAHYRLEDGQYDLDRVVIDYASQPRIVTMIEVMQAEIDLVKAKKEHRRAQQRESKRRRRRQRGRQMATH